MGERECINKVPRLRRLADFRVFHSSGTSTHHKPRRGFDRARVSRAKISIGPLIGCCRSSRSVRLALGSVRAWHLLRFFPTSKLLCKKTTSLSHRKAKGEKCARTTKTRPDDARVPSISEKKQREKSAVAKHFFLSNYGVCMMTFRLSSSQATYHMHGIAK